jgi:hypothetical protein
VYAGTDTFRPGFLKFDKYSNNLGYIGANQWAGIWPTVEEVHIDIWDADGLFSISNLYQDGEPLKVRRFRWWKSVTAKGRARSAET